LSPQKSRTGVTAGVAACSGAVETGKAWTLNATSDPSTLQAKIMANLFDMDAVSYHRAIVGRRTTA
jgi:hypothetical protein